MQGRYSPGDESGDTPTGRRLAALNGTGKQHTIPQRPPGMTRVDQPPPKPKVERPQTVKVERPKRPIPTPGNLQGRLLITLGVVLVCGLLACTIGYAAFSYVNGLSASGSPAVVANDFLQSLSQKNYNQAYRDLNVNITLQLSPDEFAQAAKNADSCYGPITQYPEVAGSAINQSSSQSYSYTITRSKLSKTYQMRLTLQQDQDAGNSWKITSYGGNLGPDQGGCKA